MNESGTALVVALLLLLVLTVMAASGMTAALLEVQMAGNEQYQERAFQAAEAGIAQAMAAGPFTTDSTASAAQFDDLSAPEPVPLRGHGMQIAGCPDQSAAAEGQCEYFLRFDSATGITPAPGSGDGSGTELRACHFVVESIGVAPRGAVSELTASFYVVGPKDCSGTLSSPPVRTYWRQRGAD